MKKSKYTIIAVLVVALLVSTMTASPAFAGKKKTNLYVTFNAAEYTSLLPGQWTNVKLDVYTDSTKSTLVDSFEPEPGYDPEAETTVGTQEAYYFSLVDVNDKNYVYVLTVSYFGIAHQYVQSWRDNNNLVPIYFDESDIVYELSITESTTVQINFIPRSYPTVQPTLDNLALAGTFPVAVDDSASTNQDTPVNLSLVANDYKDGTLTISGNVGTDAGAESTTIWVADTLTNPWTHIYDSGNLTPDVTQFSIPTDFDPTKDWPLMIWAESWFNMGGNSQQTQLDAGAGYDSSFGVTSIGTAANGTVQNNNDGTVTYTPNAGFYGTDTFAYTITDAYGKTSTATATVIIAQAAVTDPGTDPGTDPDTDPVTDPGMDPGTDTGTDIGTGVLSDSTGSNTSTGGSSTTTDAAPETSDQSDFIAWLLLLAISSGGLLATRRFVGQQS